MPDGNEHVYEHAEHQVLAVTFNRFVTTCFEPTDLDWGAIDGRWLRQPRRRLSCLTRTVPASDWAQIELVPQ